MPASPQEAGSNFTLWIDCPFCGGSLDWIAGTPTPTDKVKREDTTVLQCKQNAQHLWVVRVELMKAPVDAAATEKQRKDAERQRKHREAMRRREAVAA